MFVQVVSGIEKLVKLDQATMLKDIMQFARTIVEVSMTNSFLTSSILRIKKGACMVEERVDKSNPTTCDNCHGIGHSERTCHEKENKKTQLTVVGVKEGTTSC